MNSTIVRRVFHLVAGMAWIVFGIFHIAHAQVPVGKVHPREALIEKITSLVSTGNELARQSAAESLYPDEFSLYEELDNEEFTNLILGIDIKKNLQKQAATLRLFIEANKDRPEELLPGNGTASSVKELLYLTQKLQVEAAHQESSEVLRMTIASILEAIYLDEDEEKGIVKQQHRSTSGVIVAQPTLTRYTLMRRYKAYRRRIYRDRTMDRGRAQNSVFFNHYSYDEIWSSETKDTMGTYYRVIAGPPMLDYSALAFFESNSSDSVADDPGTLPWSHFRGEVGYRFNPAYEVPAGYSIAHAAQGLAESKLLFGCRRRGDISHARGETVRLAEDTCRFLTSSKQKGVGVEISLCSVTGNVEIDAPSSCAPFVIISNNEIWIAVIAWILEETPGGGAIGPEAPESRFVIYSDALEFSSLRAFAQALTSPPLDLDVHVKPHALRGDSPQRYSQVLSTKYDQWREWLVIFVEEESCPDDSSPKEWIKMKAVCVSFTANVLVSKQNSPEPGSWHPASEPLSARFLRQVRESFLKALRQVCSRQDMVGDRVACYSKPL